MKAYALGLIAGGFFGLGGWFASSTRPMFSLIFALGIIGLGMLLLSLTRYRRMTRIAEQHMRGVTILSVGKAVEITNPIASKGTYRSGDIAIIEELRCLPGIKIPFYKVRWLTPPPLGVPAHVRVNFLAPNEVKALDSLPAGLSTAGQASSTTITKSV